MMSYYSVSPPPRAYVSPAPSLSPVRHASPPARSGSVPPAAKPKHKPVNVFSNDGSFLERFQQMKKVRRALIVYGSDRILMFMQDEEERKKQEEIIARFTFGSITPVVETC